MSNMGTTTSRADKYMKLTQDQRALVKQVWIGIENNPQFHGSVFFMGFFEVHPQYMKYFMNDLQLPLTFDTRTNAKFTVIMETMGYLLLDFHDKPKQLDRIIGYIAMIHKDMSLARLDMSNFGKSLLEYLTITFPLALTPQCIEVVSNYLNHLLDEISRRIEDFKNDETLGNYEIAGKMKIPCGWSVCSDNLIYGQTPDYWRGRKARWEEQLNEWKIKESSIIQLTRSSTTDDEETSNLKSKTEDETSEFVESTARLLESYGIPRTTKFSTASQSMTGDLRGSSQKLTSTRPLQRGKKINTSDGEDTVAKNVVPSQKTPREKRRSFLAEKPRAREKAITISIVRNDEAKSSLRTSVEETVSSNLRVPLQIDSLARQRRRRTQAQIDPN